MRSLATAVATALLALIAGAVPLAAQQRSPVAVLQAHFAAWNNLDAAGVMRTLADDAVLEDHGTLYASRGEIEEWVRTRMPTNPGVVPSGFQLDGNRVSYEWHRMGDIVHQRLGVPQFTGRGEAVVTNDRITELRVIPDPAAMARNQVDAVTAARATITAQGTVVAQATQLAAAETPPSAPTHPGPPVVAIVVALSALVLTAALAAARRPHPS